MSVRLIRQRDGVTGSVHNSLVPQLRAGLAVGPEYRSSMRLRNTKTDAWRGIISQSRTTLQRAGSQTGDAVSSLCEGVAFEEVASPVGSTASKRLIAHANVDRTFRFSHRFARLSDPCSSEHTPIRARPRARRRGPSRSRSSPPRPISRDQIQVSAVRRGFLALPSQDSHVPGDGLACGVPR